MKQFFAKIKEDLRRLFFYPAPSFGTALGMDYDRYWKERRNEQRSGISAWQKQRADIVAGMIEPGSTVLDIGCGDGAMLLYLQEKAHIRGIGVDISEKELEKAKRAGIDVIAMDVMDMKQLSALPEADYVTGFEIIEHMPLPETFLFHISKKARKGLIFSVPNSGYYQHRLRLLFGRFPLQWVAHPGEHLRFWTVPDMRRWVSWVGYEPQHLVLYEGLPVLNNLWPSVFAQGMVVHIRPHKPSS